MAANKLYTLFSTSDRGEISSPQELQNRVRLIMNEMAMDVKKPVTIQTHRMKLNVEDNNNYFKMHKDFWRQCNHLCKLVLQHMVHHPERWFVDE